MTQPEQAKSNPPVTQKSRVRYLIPIILLFVVPVMGFLVYDLVKPMVNPCEALFRQTQNSLDTKIELLNIKSEVSIQPHKIQELTERAQIVASNLQYCCTTLSGGERRPEDFIQCKTASSEFERGLDKIIELKSEAESKPAGEAASNDALTQRLEATIEQTKSISVAFNQKIGKLQESDHLVALEGLQHENLQITSREAEPNNSLLVPNSMQLGNWIEGEISELGESDFFVIRTPEIHRDFVLLELQNKSTTLAPQAIIYSSDKNQITRTYNGTHGGNLNYRFLVAPAQTYYVQVHEFRHNRKGKYLLRLSALKLYDAHEPNQTLLQAKAVSTDDIVEANLMDGHDYDFYQFESQQTGRIEIQFDNRSSTIAPHLQLFNANKSSLLAVYDGSNGANKALQYAVEQGQLYYVRVMEYRENRSGDYRLRFRYLTE